MVLFVMVDLVEVRDSGPMGRLDTESIWCFLICWIGIFVLATS
jgi:hypothetical protein